MRKKLEKVEKTPELVLYYRNVKKFCIENGIPFKSLSPIGLTVDIRDIPTESIEGWLKVIKNE